MTDANTGTAVGWDGTILRTTDGGSTWTSQSSGTTNALESVSFIDANTGTVVGRYGTILRTTNGGASWTSQSSGTTSWLEAVSFTDANSGTAVGGDGVIRRTTDGGSNWTGQSSGTTTLLHAVNFIDANTGTVVGHYGTILRTTDGGASWVGQSNGATNHLEEVSFIDANIGTAVGWNGTILRTSNGGVDWTSQISGITNALAGVSFIDTSTGTAVGSLGVIVRTTDGGTNWASQSSGTTSSLRGVFFTDAFNGTAVGEGGVIRRTTDSGTNWTGQSSGTGTNLNNVFFVDANIGTVVGDNGVIRRTTNGGTTWVGQYTGTNEDLHDLFFIDANTGWVVGDGGGIRRTTDGGSTWTNQGVVHRLNAISFSDANTGTAVGDNGAILRTTNGGTTWTAQFSGTDRHLLGLSVTDLNTGTAVGWYGTILRTTDGGETCINPHEPILTSTSMTVCSGTGTTLSIHDGYLNDATAWQWYSGSCGGTPVGSGFSIVVSPTVTTTYYARGEGGCVTPGNCGSITITVTPAVTPAVAIVAAPGATVCAGTTVTFTATPTNGGSTPSYQWKKNGGNVGTNSATYNASSLVTGDQIECVMTSNAACASPTTATSNSITMTVNPTAASVTIAANPSGAICPGTNVTFTATPTNGGISPSYQWKKNGGNVGSDTSAYSDNAIATGDLIECVMTSSAACASPSTVNSNGITMTVSPNLVPAVSISAAPGAVICSGTNVTFTATPTNGGSTPSYQWKKNGGNVGTNSATYSTPSLVTGDLIECVMTSSAACASPATGTSNSVTMTVNPGVAPSVSISADPSGPIPLGTTVTFTAVPTNGGSSPSFQWKRNGGAVGIDSSSYSSNALAHGDMIECVMTSSATCASPATVTSNSITVSAQVSASYPVLEKWNMVSVPLTLDEYAAASVFPTAVSNAYSYQGGYSTNIVLENGVGYWVRFSQDQDVEMTGFLRTSDTVSVSEGWNMVGSVGTPIATDAITSNPGGIVASQFFGYAGSYHTAPTIEPGKAYWVKVDQAGQLVLSASSSVSAAAQTRRIRIVETGELPPPPPSGVEAGPTGRAIPMAFALHQNFPNPFNPETEIGYDLPVPGTVSLTVYDIVGQVVATLVNGMQEAGSRTVRWDASDTPSGIYFYRLRAGSFVETRKLLLIR